MKSFPNCPVSASQHLIYFPRYFHREAFLEFSSAMSSALWALYFYFRCVLSITLTTSHMWFFLSFFLACLLACLLAVLGLRCCPRAFSSCSEWGLLFVAVHRHLVAVHRHLIVVAFLCCRARAPGAQASVVVACRLSSCDTRALERRPNSCGARAQLLRDMWDLPGPGLETMSPALAGRFPTTAPPGKSPRVILEHLKGG